LLWKENRSGLSQPNLTAHEALRRIQAKGIQTVMLSGDTPLAANSIASELGIELFEGSCSPEKKVEKIKAWQEQGQKVGMVGDGVNDAPALAQANLSITTAGGSKISGRASDLVLTRPDLTLIPSFLTLSRRTRITIMENLGWAFAYNLVAVPLAMIGRITPVIAAIAMAVSSLVVVINSLRLRKS
jgi:P-type E1-E2 ATPase